MPGTCPGPASVGGSAWAGRGERPLVRRRHRSVMTCAATSATSGTLRRMKITRVESLVLNLPMVIDGPPPMLGGRARTSIDMLLVRIETDAGVVGWGESFGHRIF